MPGPYFLTIEGSEGTGKSTLIQSLAQHWQQQDIPFITTREPGGTAIAEAIREIVLTDFSEPMMSNTELLLMFAARSQHIEHVIRPALRAGKSVICDRFMDATVAYQVHGRGVSAKFVAQLNERILGDLQIDLTVLLDAPVGVGFSRLGARGSHDRIESSGLDFFERVRQGYLKQAALFPDRIHLVAADARKEVIYQQVIQLLHTHMRR